MPRKTSRDSSVSSRGQAFYCKNRQAEVTMLFCLDSFVDVNALNIKDSQCYKCQQGNKVRAEFATS